MHSLLVESWLWYAFVIFVAVSRLISRSLLLGSPLDLKIDDWLTVFAIATFTTLLVTINIVANKSSNLIQPDVDVATFTPAEITDRVLGSKLVLVVEQMQIVTIWTLKTTLLILYFRVTYRLPQYPYVKVLAVYVGVTFVVMEVFYFGVWCRPFHNYWAVPTPNEQCDTATHHLIMNVVFNITSDLAMLCIGFSLARKSKLPWKRALMIHAIFALGIFVIVAAALNKFYSFTNPYGSEWTFWYVRESATAMIVANLPYTWHLIRRLFNVGTFNGEASERRKYSFRPTRGHRGIKETAKAQILHGEHVNNTGKGGDRTSLELQFSPTRKDSTVSSRTTTPTGRDSVEPLKPAAMKTWKDRGLYGKQDLEAWGSDLEDGDDQYPANQRRRSSLAIFQLWSPGLAAHDDLVLHDVGSLGQSPQSRTERLPPKL